MPIQISIRFYEELNDFLSRDRKKKTFSYSVNGRPTVKDIIEALGVPHTEVDLILANGQAVTFDYRPDEGERIAVYPVFESLDISDVSRLRGKGLRITRFIADVHLGKLARYLRMLGFDTIYRNDLQDPEIIDIAEKENRIILTRDIPILKNGRVTHGYFVRSTRPAGQIQEVMRRFDLLNDIKPFDRCMECNGKIETVSKEEIIDKLLPGTIKHFHEFYSCTYCGKIYWKGSHYEKMEKLIEGLGY